MKDNKKNRAEAAAKAEEKKARAAADPAPEGETPEEAAEEESSLPQAAKTVRASARARVRESRRFMAKSPFLFAVTMGYASRALISFLLYPKRRQM